MSADKDRRRRIHFNDISSVAKVLRRGYMLYIMVIILIIYV